MQVTKPCVFRTTGTSRTDHSSECQTLLEKLSMVTELQLRTRAEHNVTFNNRQCSVCNRLILRNNRIWVPTYTRGHETRHWMCITCYSNYYNNNNNINNSLHQESPIENVNICDTGESHLSRCKKEIQEILFENAEQIPNGVYIKLMRALLIQD